MKWSDWVNTQGDTLTLRNYEDETLSHASFDAGKHSAAFRAWMFITQHFYPSGMKNDGTVNWGIDGFTEEQFQEYVENN